MKIVNVTNQDGISVTKTIAINLRNIIRYYNNVSTKAVVLYDVEPGGKNKPISLTLDIAKATLDSLVATDAQLTMITCNVLDSATGVTTATSFNEKYLVSLMDSKAWINGAIDTSVVEFIYSQGGFVNKRLYIDGTLAALVSSNAAEILTYSFAGVALSTSVINAASRTIAVEVPNATDVSAIVATFTTSANLTSIKVGATAQTSAATANNFTSPITYTLVAADGITTRSWVVTVTIAAP